MRKSVPADWNMLVYTLAGEASFGSELVVDRSEESHLLVFPASDAGDADGLFVACAAGEDTPAQFMLLAGRAHNAPGCHRGPFYLNSFEQMQTAVQDFQEGINGFEGAPGWHSSIAKDCEIISLDKK